MASPTGTGVNIPKTCNFAFYMEFNTAKLYFPSKLLQLSSTFAPSSINTFNTFNTRSPFSLASKPPINKYGWAHLNGDPFQRRVAANDVI